MVSNCQTAELSTGNAGEGACISGRMRKAEDEDKQKLGGSKQKRSME